MADLTIKSESSLMEIQINTIQTTIQEINRKQDVQNVKLFGEDNGSENAQGRLPRLEQQNKINEDRIGRIEDKLILYGAFIASINAAVAAGLAAFFHHIWH
jgi:hypothetical protein